MEEIRQLLAITQKLKAKYRHLNKAFTLDGKLVGDIGEVLAAEQYGLRLYKSNTPRHDGEEIATGRKVQIKASFKGYCYYPCGKDRVPDYFLSVQVLENGKLEELFNGPGRFLVENYIRKNKLKPYNQSYYTLSRGQLRKWNKLVPAAQKIGTSLKK